MYLSLINSLGFAGEGRSVKGKVSVADLFPSEVV
ncbi:hypothetical protein SAMN04515668_2525 [Hymenobacter arizonensis]|uniref:Uncharacterized protein n=1 Tax=Hymenobacter arizonensis TaxID=1227077 RepID=A0A1I5YXQ8_HYMAR|nr:hypothetical protein SAMN04515668_2525 [Hymenobacter arizonensis]